MSAFKRGDRVRVTIDAEVLAVDSNNDLSIGYPSGRGRRETPITDDSDAVTIEHVAPADWPPQRADLWRDKDGDIWFAAIANDEQVIMRCSADGLSPRTPLHLQDVYAPLTLVHREHTKTPQPAPISPKIDVRVGDLFRDADGSLWFVVEEDAVALLGDSSSFHDIGDMLKWGPLTRVWRSES